MFAAPVGVMMPRSVDVSGAAGGKLIKLRLATVEHFGFDLPARTVFNRHVDIELRFLVVSGALHQVQRVQLYRATLRTRQYRSDQRSPREQVSQLDLRDQRG